MGVALIISFAEATATLLNGTVLAWSKFEDHKAGSICLGGAGQRRLLRFLLEQPTAKVVLADESLFAGLISAWCETTDPAVSTSESTVSGSSGSWRLMNLQASGFGGLTIFGGPAFEQWIGGENWCLEGQNGSGKSSFANAILWALTGQRVREQDGLVQDSGGRAPVYNEIGGELGKWPPLVSYPERASELRNDAEVWVRLTFKNTDGETATAFRKVVSSSNDELITEVTIDPRLVAAPQLIETGLLMPARIPRIGFGNKSQSLYEAVKLLTGLDQLADIAEAARLLSHKAQPFLKYAKQQGADNQQTIFADAITKAEAKAGALGIDLATCRTLGQKGVETSLTKYSQAAAVKAAEHLAILKAEIADGLDVGQAAIRKKIGEAVGSARAILTSVSRRSPSFRRGRY